MTAFISNGQHVPLPVCDVSNDYCQPPGASGSTYGFSFVRCFSLTTDSTPSTVDQISDPSVSGTLGPSWYKCRFVANVMNKSTAVDFVLLSFQVRFATGTGRTMISPISSPAMGWLVQRPNWASQIFSTTTLPATPVGSVMPVTHIERTFELFAPGGSYPIVDIADYSTSASQSYLCSYTLEMTPTGQQVVNAV